MAKGEFPRDEIKNFRADDLFTDVGDFRAGSLGDVGGDDAGIDKLQIPQAFRQGHSFPTGFSLRQIHLSGGRVTPHNKPLTQGNSLGRKTQWILCRVHSVHQSLCINYKFHWINIFLQ